MKDDVPKAGYYLTKTQKTLMIAEAWVLNPDSKKRVMCTNNKNAAMIAEDYLQAMASRN